METTKENAPKQEQQPSTAQITVGDNKKKRNRNRNRNKNKQGGADEPKDQSSSDQKVWAQKKTPLAGAQNHNATKFEDANKQPVIKSEEEGFTGTTEEWFDDNEYKKQMVHELSKKDHDYYYGSYSHFYIHEEMLKDTVRTRTYQQAIENNPQDFKDKIVLDIGAGTGILSIFAARAGAKHVYAIENAEIAYFAEEIVKNNGLSDKITVIKGKMEEVELPVKEVDIIISEWMGYFLLYESMFDSVLWARDKYLVKGGKMLPDKADIYIAAIEDGQYKQEKKNFWNDVYGVDMSCMQPTVMKEPLVDLVNSNMIMSKPSKICSLDLCTMNKDDVEFASQYRLEMMYDDKVHGIVGWFDCHFADLQHPVTLSTSPYARSTHWKQTVFYLEHDLQVRKGDVLYGSVANRRSKTNFRELDIKVSYHIEAPQVRRHFTNLYKLK